MIKVLYDLKQNNLSHMDIKPVNILVSKQNNKFELKLSDFGASR